MTAAATASFQPSVRAVHRFEVRPRDVAADARGRSALAQAKSLGINPLPTRVGYTWVYLIDGALDETELGRIGTELLTDPVTQVCRRGAAAAASGSAVIEVHPLPGVTDPAAESVQLAVKALLGEDVRVRTGMRFDVEGVSADVARGIAERCWANTVIHAVHVGPYHPTSFPTGRPQEFRIVEVPIRSLDDAALEKLSREAHLFLSLEEMQAIREQYRRIGRDPRDIELETLAQTWSEHCVHKTLKATIRYQEGHRGIEASRHQGEVSIAELARKGRPGHEVNADGSVTIRNLLKSTVAAATHELMRDGIDWCLSVFVDNAGVIAFDEAWAVCFKVETHNHPSAIEPYGGAATGIGGCIRDVIGTGLSAKPIAATDVFCVAPPDLAEVPKGCLPPRRILSQVVAGVRDYGNRMGIPTINGTVWFDERYVGNPLVYCGCIGLMPRDLVRGEAREGDRIIAVGGRTGRDGIHGATFSSAELTDTHADEFSHAVQIGNAITEKKALDAILAARDAEDGPLFSAITDCGAGGFSSAVGEMGKELGARVDLERAPLKYDGLTPTEIWISEAQERMVLAVPEAKLDRLKRLFDDHDVEWCDLGRFGETNSSGASRLALRWHGREIGELDMHFLHDGVPMPTREARWAPAAGGSAGTGRPATVADRLRQLLSHPNIASKRWIIRQYDHEVQGGSAVKPLVGPTQEGPSDASVIVPVPTSKRGLAVANGLATGLKDDPYLMVLAAIDECVRNLVCVGADPSRIAILDNFCWPSCKKAENLGSLVRAAEACYDGAKAYRTPFISGKDSLNNQFTTESGETIEIPPTLLISGFGIVESVDQCVTMDAKSAGNVLVIVGETGSAMGGSHVSLLGGAVDDASLPRVDLKRGPATAKAIHGLIQAGLVKSAHDCSEGGLLVAAAEMAFSGNLGLALDLSLLPRMGNLTIDQACFAESPSRYLLELEPSALSKVQERLEEIPMGVIGQFTNDGRLTLRDAELSIGVDELLKTWLAPLNWG